MTSALTMEGEIMNRQLIGILFAGCLLALLAAVPAQAQLPGVPIRVTIPFDFNVRGKTLSSGKYEIRRIGDEPDGLLIYNLTNHQHAVFESEPVETSRPPRRGEVVFHEYGDTYFLAQIWTGGEETGRELIPSRDEKRLEQDLADKGGAPVMVALATE
jgi:hypothetical protein